MNINIFQLQREQEKEDVNLKTPNPNDLVALQLQKQVNELTSQIQTLTKQNNKLKETKKTQYLTSEDKVNTLQAFVQGLQETILTQNKINNNANRSGNGDVEIADCNSEVRILTKQNKGKK